jgi:hypothetical protein
MCFGINALRSFFFNLAANVEAILICHIQSGGLLAVT